ncbi:MAG: hypothetical protein A2W77_06850 [Nitrospinae bacterium RIFCSPLOWO2_12_39_16]|nr:MAG: hypothetical protein A2W77_06850 [Nitrospinae bacterium RIFCSPLOWO2_12_39_16]
MIDAKMKMKTRIRDSQAVVENFTALHQGKIPEHLMKKDAQRIGKEFDPNLYFTVLTHLTLVTGYTLDYVYRYTGFGGSPLLYVRQLDTPPLKDSFNKFEEFWKEKPFQDELNKIIQRESEKRGYMKK